MGPDEDRQILRQSQEPGRVGVRIGTEALDTAQNGRTGHSPRAQQGDDRLIEGRGVVMIGTT